MSDITLDRAKLIRSLRKAAKRLEGNEAEAFSRVLDDIRKDTKGHYLSYSQEQPAKVSYASRPEHKLDNAQRTRTTLGRYIRRHLGVSKDDLPDKTLHEVSREVFAHLVRGIQAISTISGDAITEAYRTAVGGVSCMTGDDHCRYTELYALNPDVVSMVVYGDNQARALLWKTDQEAMVLDRVYPNDGVHVNVLRNWAAANGYVYCCNNSLPDGDVALSDGCQYTVTLKHNDTFPYIDTFCYGDIDGSTVRLSNDSEFDRRGADAVTYEYDWEHIVGKHFETGFGSFSDISSLGHLGCMAVNIGVGYYDEHSPRAFVVLEQYLSQLAKFVRFHREYKDRHFPYDESVHAGMPASGWFGGYQDADDEFITCDKCGCAFYEHETIGTALSVMCPECGRDIQVEDIQEEREEAEDYVCEEAWGPLGFRSTP